MLALLYTCGIAEKRRLEISRACASADNSLYLKKTSKNQNDYMENAHQKEESFFPFGVSQRTFCSAAGQLSSFRVACVADRISSRNKLKFF